MKMSRLCWLGPLSAQLAVQLEMRRPARCDGVILLFFCHHVSSDHTVLEDGETRTLCLCVSPIESSYSSYPDQLLTGIAELLFRHSSAL